MAHFGEHLMIDGYGGDKEKLNNKKLVLKCLDELPTLLGMKKLADPLMVWAEPNGKKDPGGWSGVILIAESHISIHTFPARGFLTADVYSCRNGMDTKLVASYFKKLFDLDDLERNFIKRGTRYPYRDIHKYGQKI